MKSTILKSLETNSTTIIPNFGAIMKMGKSTLFNEFLKYDDGKLAQVYAIEKGVSIEEAKENINKFITQVNSNIEGGNSHILEGIGTFSKVGGKLKFVADKITGTASSTKLVTKTEVKKEQPVKEIEKPKTEKVKETKPVTPKKVEVKPVTPKKVEVKPVTPKSSEKIEEIKSPKTAVSNIESTTDSVEVNKVKTSVDFLTDKAISKINAYSNKSDLLDFTRADKRKTVVDALNKKLKDLNPSATETPKKVEKVTKPVVVAKKITPPAPAEKKETPVEKVTPIVPVQKTKVEVKKPEVKTEKEIPKVTAVKPVVSEEKKVEVKKPETKIDPKITPVTPEVKATPIVEKTKETVKETIKDATKKSIVDEKVIAAISTGLDKTEKETKKRKRRKLVLWLAIICLLIGVGIFGYLKQNLVKGWFGMNNEIAATDSSESDDDNEEVIGDDENTEDIENTEDDAIETESIETEDNTESETDEVEPDTEPEVVVEPEVIPEVKVDPKPVKVTPVATVSSATGSYHVVVGSYASEDNAEKKVKKLNKLGYPDAAVLGKFGALYKVKVASYDSKSAANSAKSDLKAKDISSTVKKY
ncbi:MAG: hypothetical protein ACI9N1_000378 [Flavobacteriales bacterium]|jgi:hypothetical protein